MIKFLSGCIKKEKKRKEKKNFILRPVMENSVCMIGMFMSYSIFENMTVGL